LWVKQGFYLIIFYVSKLGNNKQMIRNSVKSHRILFFVGSFHKKVLNVFSRNEHHLDFSLQAFFELVVLKTKTFMFLNVFKNSDKASISLIFTVKFALSQCN